MTPAVLQREERRKKALSCSQSYPNLLPSSQSYPHLPNSPPTHIDKYLFIPLKFGMLVVHFDVSFGFLFIYGG